MDIRLEPIVPEYVIDPDALERQFKSAVSNLISEAERHYGTATADWDHDTEFKRDSGFDGSDYFDETISEDPPLFYVDGGTDIRHAVMTRDFISKTVPNSLSSRKGRGGLAFVHPRLMLPGIEARNFTINIIKLLDRKLAPLFNRILEKIK